MGINPLISVIIPVYNTGHYLEECFRSICSQTYTDLEILAVDDGSTDGSSTSLDVFAAKDSRIRVIHQKNAGVSAARNTGLALANGDYVAFVDSDDQLELDMYETLIKLAEDYQADIAHCGYKRINSDGTFKDVQGTGQLLIQDSREAVECLLSGRFFVGSLWNKLYRRELFHNVWFDTALNTNEDVLANVQVFRNARIVAFLDVPKYYYFDREDSSCSRTPKLRRSRDCVSAAEKMQEVCKDTELERICVGRVADSLIHLYRVCLMADIRGTKAERSRIHDRICAVLPQSGGIPFRSMINYRLMHFAPRLYRIAYSVYDRIRKPNWDL